jgi:hypothetical protein
LTPGRRADKIAVRGAFATPAARSGTGRMDLMSRRRVEIVSWLALCAWFSLQAAGLTAGASPEHVLDDETLLMDPADDVLAVTIRKVTDSGATNARPPRVRISVGGGAAGRAGPGPGGARSARRSAAHR